MNRHQRRAKGANVGAMDVRYDGKTVSVEMHLAFPLVTPRAELLRVGSEAAVRLEHVVKGTLHHMALTAATSEREAGLVRVKITCMANSPESIEELTPRVQLLVSQGQWTVIYCSVCELDEADAAEAWAKMRAVALGAGAVEAKPS